MMGYLVIGIICFIVGVLAGSYVEYRYWKP